MYFIIDKIDGYTEENIVNRYLTIVSNNKNKELLTKYTALWNKIKEQVQTINGKPREYGRELMKIKIISDDNLPLGKVLNLHNMTIVLKSVF